ncbi:MAG: lyase family protein, partial [Saprospiraceae bacterium]|nr:lyase family protein [Saprospiraceae bacterium]
MLKAISPIDGRYHSKTKELSDFFSEFALIRYRIMVEIEYFLSLANERLQGMDDYPRNMDDDLRHIYQDFSQKDAEHIKDIESRTNHDVKAVEYFLKEKLDEMGLGKYREMVHFGLTSQDVNNTAVPLSI